MKPKPFTREGLIYLKSKLINNDGLSEEEATKRIANLIESQKTLPTPLKTPNKGNFQEEFRKLKQSKKHRNT